MLVLGEIMTSQEYLDLLRPNYGQEARIANQSHNEALIGLEERGFGQLEYMPLSQSQQYRAQEYGQMLITLGALEATHQRSLTETLLARLHSLTYGCFENLVLDVVRAAGFATSRPDLSHHLGRSGDGGIDGIIDLDDFGLDAIYIQAKRLRPGTVVGAAAVRDFLGSLETRHASKGIFVTTGQFSQPAMEVVKSVTRRITLVDGNRLAGLMIRYEVGLRLIKTFRFQELDDLWFQQAERQALKIC